MNLTKIGMENLCTFHQQPHSERNCPQWINSMTLVMNQMLDSRLTEEDDDEKKENAASTSTKEQEEETMALWSSVSLLDAEEDITKKHKDIREANVTTRSQGTVSNDSILLPKIRRLQRNIRKKFQDKSVAGKTPEFTITSQDPKQNRMFPKPNEEKVSADKSLSIKQQLEYDVVEDLKKIKANVPLFEMCKVPQQKERLLKALETSEEERPTVRRGATCCQSASG